MSVIALPSFETAAFKWSLRHSEIESRSVFGSQTIEVAFPLWQVEINGAPTTTFAAPVIEAFMEAMSGMRNQVELYNRAQTVPRGTYRGNLTMLTYKPEGATTLTINGGQAFGTFLRGDLIGFGSGINQQVVRITNDVTAIGTGIMTANINPPLRTPISAGEEIRWLKPAALFRQIGDNNGIEYTPGIGQPWKMSFLEDARP